MVEPVFRVAGAEESEPSGERNEDPSLVTRFEHDCVVRSASRLSALIQLTRPNLGHAQRPTIGPYSGHRLANGLLAPMTC